VRQAGQVIAAVSGAVVVFITVLALMFYVPKVVACHHQRGTMQGMTCNVDGTGITPIDGYNKSNTVPP
jgi:hypothetical protein